MKRISMILSLALALPALAASYSSGSRSSGSSRSYSSGSSSGSRSYSSGSSRSYSSGSSSKSYSSGSTSKPSSPSKSYSSPSSSAAKAMKMQESQRSYSSYQQKAAPPTTAPSYTTGSYSTRSYSTRYSDPDYWSKRRERERRVFGSQPQPQTTVVHNYSDGISPMFWGYMMGQSLNNQAAWAYHHRYDMDDARYRELLARDAALEAKVKAMEAEGIKRDPNYLPEGVDEDLVYSKPKQPEPQVTMSAPQPQEVIAAPEKEDDGTGFFTWLLVLTGVGCAGYAAYYFVFKKKYSF